MLLNRLEFTLMNNPVRAALQRHVEARRFLRMGGPLPGAKALEIGCGRGVGVELILDVFGAASVDAFDLDPRMITLARRRLRRHAPRVRLWVGNAAAIEAPDAAYDAVFDFGIIHHVPNWGVALDEVRRVLRPGGVLYAEEPLGGFLNHPLMHRLFAHPVADRFDAVDFRNALRASGLVPTRARQLWQMMFWFVATKPGPNQPVLERAAATNP
jgi:ubiquinone/menaquinone biosynthesis C-methylase UbiE